MSIKADPTWRNVMDLSKKASSTSGAAYVLPRTGRDAGLESDSTEADTLARKERQSFLNNVRLRESSSACTLRFERCRNCDR